MEENSAKLSDKAEDHFRIIQLCLHNNATDVVGAGSSENKELQNTTPKNKANGGSSVGVTSENTARKCENNNDDDDDDSEDSVFDENLFKRFAELHATADAASETIAPAQSSSHANTTMEAFADDIEKIKKFMLDFQESKNVENSQPWKEDIEQIRQEHQRELYNYEERIQNQRTQNDGLSHVVNLKMEQLKICEESRQREHATLLQRIDEQAKQIKNLEGEQLTVKTCLMAFEGLYKNLYDDINHIKLQHNDDPKQNPSSETERKQLREETVALVRQEVIKRMDGFLEVAFKNLRSMTAATAPTPPLHVDDNSKNGALMHQMQANVNKNNAPTVPRLMDIKTNVAPVAADTRGAILQTINSTEQQLRHNAKNKYNKPYHPKNANANKNYYSDSPRPMQEANNANTKNLGNQQAMPLQQPNNANLIDLTEQRGLMLPSGNGPNISATVAVPMQQPISYDNNGAYSSFILDLLQRSANNSIMGIPPQTQYMPQQPNANNLISEAAQSLQQQQQQQQQHAGVMDSVPRQNQAYNNNKQRSAKV